MPEQPTGPLDVTTIHQLVRLMKKYDLTALDLGDGPTRIRLRRRGPEAAASFAYAPTPTPPPQQAPAAAPPPAPAAPPPSNEIVIESPMVGTFYAAASPDAPPFVNLGSNVRPDTTVCVIEAMKVFTDIPAGVTGVVTEALVKNGQSVEFGQPLFRVRPA